VDGRDKPGQDDQKESCSRSLQPGFFPRTALPQAGRGVLRGFAGATPIWSPLSSACSAFCIPKIAATACYRCGMLALIFALAVRLFVPIVVAVAARPSHFPCCFPARPRSRERFSLPTRVGNLAQAIDITRNFRSSRDDFGLETKNFPAVSLSAGNIAAAGVRTCRGRGCRRPGRGRPIRACRSGPAGFRWCRRPRCRSGRHGRSGRPGIRR
jgi:hypothetical protein